MRSGVSEKSRADLRFLWIPRPLFRWGHEREVLKTWKIVNLKPETLERLREILKRNFGQELNDQELHDAAFNLVGYFDLLTKLYYEDYIAGSGIKNNDGKAVQS